MSALTIIQQKAFNSDPQEDIVVNSVHPGYVATDMSSYKGPLTIEQGKNFYNIRWKIIITKFYFHFYS